VSECDYYLVLVTVLLVLKVSAEMEAFKAPGTDGNIYFGLARAVFNIACLATLFVSEFVFAIWTGLIVCRFFFPTP
jgi:hypothetical protein